MSLACVQATASFVASARNRPWRRARPNVWLLSLVAVWMLSLVPQPLWACAACYGQSDSPMAAGMNWGIMSLLATIVFVLGGVAGFFVFLARRSIKMAAAAKSGGLAPETATASLLLPNDSAHSQPEPIGGRAGLGRVSALAQRRKGCAHASKESVRRRHD